MVSKNGLSAETLAEMEPPLEDQSKILWDMVIGYEKGQVFFTALDMGVFNRLKEPKSAEGISSEFGCHQQVTEKLLDVLVSSGLLFKEDGRYSIAPKMIPFLVEGEPYFAHFLDYYKNSWNQWANLKEVLKAGPASGGQKHGHTYDPETIDWMARTTLLGRLQATLKHIRVYPEFKAAKKLIDLGGGHGLFSIGFAQENPDMKVVIFEQPEVAEIAQEYISEYCLGERIKVMCGDYTKDDLGAGYDIAFEACSFGGTFEQAKNFYKRAADTLNSGGLFIVQTFTIDDDRTQPLGILTWDLLAQITGADQMNVRTDSEMLGILEDAGLNVETVVDLSNSMAMPMKLFVAKKG